VDCRTNAERMTLYNFLKVYRAISDWSCRNEKFGHVRPKE